MKGLISAIQFITILPAGKSETFDPAGMIPYFPVAGLIIGFLLSVFDMAVCQLWSRSAASVLDVVFLVWITGAFHLDGLGDTADGLYGCRTREKSLEIMKDSRIGAMALVTVVCALGIKWAGLSDLIHHRPLFLIMIPAYARGAMLFGFRFLEYGRPDGGTGHAFFQKKIQWKEFRFLALPVFLSLFCGWRGLVVNAVFAVMLILLLRFYKKRMGCITGDMLGAMAEIAESGLFMAAALGGSA